MIFFLLFIFFVSILLPRVMFHQMLTLPEQKYTYIVYLKSSQTGLVSGNLFSRSVVVLMRASPSETNRMCDFAEAKKNIDLNCKRDYNLGIFSLFPLAKQKHD